MGAGDKIKTQQKHSWERAKRRKKGKPAAGKAAKKRGGKKGKMAEKEEQQEEQNEVQLNEKKGKSSIGVVVSTVASDCVQVVGQRTREELRKERVGLRRRQVEKMRRRNGGHCRSP